MTVATVVLFATAVLPVAAFATTISLDPADATVHDILSIGAGFDMTTLFLTATFRGGTFDPNPNNFGFAFLLDTDLNVSTGNLFVDPGTGRQLGPEFFVQYHRADHPPGTALVDFTGPGGEVITGIVPVLFGTDTLAIAVPLSLIGNSNGVVNFGLEVGIPLFPGAPVVAFTVTDFAFSTEPSTPVPAAVPEPGNLTMLSVGILTLLVGYRYLLRGCAPSGIRRGSVK